MKRILKRLSEKADRLAAKASEHKNKIVAAGTVALGTVQAQAAVVMPTVSYTDIEAAAVIGFGISITVGLLMKAKRFFA